MSIAGFFSILLHLWLPWPCPKSSTDTGCFHYWDSLQQKLDHCESTDTITIHYNPTFYCKKPGEMRCLVYLIMLILKFMVVIPFCSLLLKIQPLRQNIWEIIVLLLIILWLFCWKDTSLMTPGIKSLLRNR